MSWIEPIWKRCQNIYTPNRFRWLEYIPMNMLYLIYKTVEGNYETVSHHYTLTNHDIIMSIR